MTKSEAGRTIRIKSSFGDMIKGIESLTWTEALGEGFSGIVHLISDEENLDLTSILQQSVTISFATNDEAGTFLNGFVYRAENLGTHGNHFQYRLQIGSCLELLNFSGGYRVFQDMSTIEIAEKIFDERKIKQNLLNKTTQTYVPRSYCVQFGETDQAFLQRLFEEEGIYYFFSHHDNSHILTLADDVSAHSPAKGYETVSYRYKIHPGSDEFLSNLSKTVNYGTGKISLGDYDYEKPSLALVAVKISSAVETPMERYDFPGRHKTVDAGQKAAQIRMEAIDAQREQVTLSGNTKGIRAGYTFKLADHKTANLNEEYLVVASALTFFDRGWATGQVSQFEISNTLTCQSKNIPFRLEERVPKPRVCGPQIATVTGKAGEEIWTDSLGRVKIQFPWDRLGTNDEKSSCWVRVAQLWTGNTWGAFSLPRIGEEVIVEFVNGDPDQPLVTGRVHNSARKPPYTLPDSQAKQYFEREVRRVATTQPFTSFRSMTHLGKS